MNDYKIVIASNINYHCKTFDKLIESLLLCGFDKQNIIFYISGDNILYKKRAITYINNIKCIYVPHNSFEVTPLIDISRNDKEFDYFFLLHDTCYVGPEFKSKISNFDTSFDIKYLHDRTSMNIGMYSTEHVIKRREHLDSFYNEDLTKLGLGNIKNKIIHCNGLDDVLYSVTDRNKICFYKPLEEKEKMSIIYTPNSGYDQYKKISHIADYDFQHKIIEYRSYVDLYKIKGNWSPKSSEDYIISI